MTGSIIGPEQQGLQAGFGLPEVIAGVGAPDGVIFATSGALLFDATNGTLYRNDTVDGLGAGSSWTANLI